MYQILLALYTKIVILNVDSLTREIQMNEQISKMIDKLRDVQRDSFVDLIRAYFKSGGLEIETPGVLIEQIKNDRDTLISLINSIADKTINDIEQKVN